jgi:hypothetical protein
MICGESKGIEWRAPCSLCSRIVRADSSFPDKTKHYVLGTRETRGCLTQNKTSRAGSGVIYGLLDKTFLRALFIPKNFADAVLLLSIQEAALRECSKSATSGLLGL